MVVKTDFRSSGEVVRIGTALVRVSKDDSRDRNPGAYVVPGKASGATENRKNLDECWELGVSAWSVTSGENTRGAMSKTSFLCKMNSILISLRAGLADFSKAPPGNG